MSTLVVTGASGLSTSPASAFPGDINTVAGTGSAGYGGDGGPATAAGINSPYDIAADAAGNYYIADSGNCRIRKVSPLGTISTVAGNGICGFAGDGGSATSARLNIPRGVAVDAAGNLYIADSENCRIRRVLAGLGSISTVAGNGTCGDGGDLGPATSARLNIPRGVAVDAAGNLYIADTQNSRVRRVTGTVITTVAGNGTQGYSGDLGLATSASLWYPYAVAVDGAGNVHIADTYNCRVRVVAGALIATVAGNGSCASGGDFGLAISASVHRPTGIAVDAVGQLYVAEADGCRVRRVTAELITTVAGGNGCGYGGDGGPATAASVSQLRGVDVDPVGNLYIADLPNDRVRRVEITPTVTTSPTVPSTTSTSIPIPSTTVLPSGATAMTLTPPSQTRAVDSTASLTAHVVDQNGNPMAGASVSFVVSGANPQSPPPVATDASGNAVLDYVGANTGNDVVQASVGSTTAKAAATVAWQQSGAGYPSHDCLTSAGNVITGFVNDAHVTLRTDTVGGQTWVCVHADNGASHAGGRAVVSGAVGLPTQDDNFGACDADPANRTLNQDGFVGPITFEVDVNQYPGEVWVCVTLVDTAGKRVVVPTSGTPTANFLADPTAPFPYVETPAPVGKASSDCQNAAGGRTRLVNADVGTGHVWSYAWQESLTLAHACTRVEGATNAGGRLTVDAGSASQTFITTDSSSDFTPCDTPIAGLSTPPVLFKAHVGVPAWVCGQVLSTFLRVKLDPGGSQGVATFTQDS